MGLHYGNSRIRHSEKIIKITSNLVKLNLSRFLSKTSAEYIQINCSGKLAVFLKLRVSRHGCQARQEAAWIKCMSSLSSVLNSYCLASPELFCLPLLLHFLLHFQSHMIWIIFLLRHLFIPFQLTTFRYNLALANNGSYVLHTSTQHHRLTALCK